IIWSFYRLNVKKIQNEIKIKSAFDKQVSELEMKALRAQMNPHFIFNSLNSIQKFIFEKDEYAASQYLTKFSRLIRHILDQSNQEFTPIYQEIELIKIYIEMEKLRFDDQFTFELSIDTDINTTWMIPSMVIQPLLENAIWHGLLHKKDCGTLILLFEKLSESQIKISIKDNGVGRDKAHALKSKQLLKKKSYGSKISEERIINIDNIYGGNASYEVVDLFDENRRSAGTLVNIVLPVIENNEITP
ncbi:MAG: histidine kinase, partial [Saprospiraceae bacterium]